MGLTQPAVSHALKRLRSLNNDPLFLRRAHGLEPTALAHELEPKVRRIVRLILETLTDQEEFDPKKTSINLGLGAFDYELATILPDLVAKLRSVSPNVGIHTDPLSNHEALEALVDGQIDLAVGYFDFPNKRADAFVAERLCTERYVVAARQGHRLLSNFTSLEQSAEADHLLVSSFGPVQNLVDHALQLQGHGRNIQMIVPSLFAALSIVESSDLVVTLPQRVAERNARRFNIMYRPLPMDGRSFELHVVRHARDAQNSVHLWIVDLLKTLVMADMDEA